MRYSQIHDIIKELKPKIVLEIGTHKAVRPREWYSVHKFDMYYGFDVFDDGDVELNQKEMNGKGFSTLYHAQNVLWDIPNVLIKGNTNETLPEFVHKFPGEIDFAFIDGGHSEPTIENDWEWVSRIMRPGGVVVFDDYYKPERPGFGCNETVENLEHEILPQTEFNTYLVRVDI